MSAALRPRVLVAEDDREMRRLVVETLERVGLEVIEASDGGRLLVLIGKTYASGDRAHVFDLIVSDVRMPICSGLQILRMLRDANWRTPIIVMTAFGDDETRRNAGELGAIFFDKPFELADLRAEVCRVLGWPRA
jgi:DNA-binding response OmpR family regulator